MMGSIVAHRLPLSMHSASMHSACGACRGQTLRPRWRRPCSSTRRARINGRTNVSRKSSFATLRRSMSRMARSSTRNKISERHWESMPSVYLRNSNLQIQDTIMLSPLPPPCPSLPLLFAAVSAIGSLRNTGERHAFFGASVFDCATGTSRLPKQIYSMSDLPSQRDRASRLAIEAIKAMLAARAGRRRK